MTLKQCELVLAVMFICALGGCATPAGPAYEAGVAVKDESLAQALQQAVRKTWPLAFRTSARCVFTGPKGEFAFTGHVLAAAGGEIRLVALNDFGSVVFEVASSPSGQAVVIRNHSDWSDAAVVNCALRDVSTICRKQPPQAAAVVRHADGVEGLYWETAGNREELQFDPQTHRLRRYVKARGERIIYDIVVSGGLNESVPTDFTVRDYRGGYRLSMHVLKLDPVPDGGVQQGH